MAQALPHTHLSTSRLVRVLADLAVSDGPASKQPFADRLGQWLGFNDALALFSALNAGTGEGAALQPALAAGADVRKVFARVRGAMVDAITVDGVRKQAMESIEALAQAADAGAQCKSDVAPDFAPFHRYYLARQRDMSASIGPLRVTVRAALSAHSSALRQLAALDAVLDQALAGRERDLLASVPALLGRRFERLYTAHRVTVVEAQIADDPARWMEAGAWLALFCRELHAVLLAEADLRLQPVAGLIAALDNEVTRKQ